MGQIMAISECYVKFTSFGILEINEQCACIEKNLHKTVYTLMSGANKKWVVSACKLTKKSFCRHFQCLCYVHVYLCKKGEEGSTPNPFPRSDAYCTCIKSSLELITRYKK